MLVLCSSVAACGDTLPETRAPAASKTTPLPPGSLARADVVRVVDAGLGQFLSQLQVEPSLEDGRFVGFRVVQLLPESFWRDTDLRPGDVVTHVNDSSVEDPNQAFQVFESLREVTVLKVRLLRDGKAKELKFPIVGAPAPKPASSTPSTPT
jgi:type II secretory pathway component PulC